MLCRDHLQQCPDNVLLCLSRESVPCAYPTWQSLSSFAPQSKFVISVMSKDATIDLVGYIYGQLVAIFELGIVMVFCSAGQCAVVDRQRASACKVARFY